MCDIGICQTSDELRFAAPLEPGAWWKLKLYPPQRWHDVSRRSGQRR
jgi:hypothetical protein